MKTKVRNKINTQIKKPHLKKGFPIKTVNIGFEYRWLLQSENKTFEPKSFIESFVSFRFV